MGAALPFTWEILKMSAYELARELATNGSDLFIAEVLAELYHNWEGTYNAVVQEIKAEIEWNSDQ